MIKHNSTNIFEYFWIEFLQICEMNGIQMVNLKNLMLTLKLSGYTVIEEKTQVGEEIFIRYVSLSKFRFVDIYQYYNFVRLS